MPLRGRAPSVRHGSHRDTKPQYHRGAGLAPAAAPGLRECAARAAGSAGGGARGSRGRPLALERPDLAARPAALRGDGASCGGGAAGRRSSAGGSVRKRGHVGALWRGGSGGRRQQCGGRAAAAGTARRCGAAGVGCGFRWVSLVCAFLHAPEETSLSHARAWSTTNCEVRARGCRRDCPVGGRCAHAPSMRCCRQAALPAPITTLRVQW